ATLGVEGLEFYFDFLDLKDPAGWGEYRRRVEDRGMTIPMLCASPDFTHPDETFRREQIEKQRGCIDMTAELGGQFCRVLSGQRRPEVSREDGLRYAADSIRACIPHAQDRGVTLTIENHYKDNYWTYPEFAQQMDVFCELVEMIDSPSVRLHLDVKAMSAEEKPIPDIIRDCAQHLEHFHANDANRRGPGMGEIDFIPILETLKDVNYDGWVSVEVFDYEPGVEALARESIEYLQTCLADLAK
ncbi:MAG: TIM barrel protein, partial [Planctomycetes bacterium]|nr:TIM barrel protein [Planctomycetota bacterium]